MNLHGVLSSVSFEVRHAERAAYSLRLSLRPYFLECLITWPKSIRELVYERIEGNRLVDIIVAIDHQDEFFICHRLFRWDEGYARLHPNRGKRLRDAQQYGIVRVLCTFLDIFRVCRFTLA